MNNRDWERFGEDIRRTIQDAVEYGNYDRLNQTITNTVNQATDWVSRNMKNMGTQNRGPAPGHGPEMHSQPNYQQKNYQQQSRKVQRTELFKVNTSTKVAGILFVVFGSVFGVLSFVWTLLLALAGMISSDLGAEVWILLIPSIVLTCGLIFMGIKGITRLLQLHRFNLYKKEIGNAEMCNITALAPCVGKTVADVVKDVEKMIQKGWFRQGHLDSQKTCLIVTDKMYHQYLQLEQQKEQQRKEAETELNKQKHLSPEVQKVIAQGDAFVKKIRECNDAIPGEEISEKIYRIEMVVDKIFDRVEQNPESISDIRKLMDYYLPTTVKLLEAYAQMDAQPVGGINIQTAKKEIEATLDTLNVAFEKLLDSLFQHAAWDVSSDISVLNTMLAQEGLKEDGLKK